MNKRKLFLYLLFVIMIFHGIVFGKELRYEDSDLKGKLVYDKNENRPFTGILKRYYKSGEIYRETSYKEGKKDGLEKEYYTNGVLLADMMYKDGKSNGPAHEYFSDGSIVSESKYALVPIRDVSSLLVEHKIYDGMIPTEYIYDYFDSKTAIRNCYTGDGTIFDNKVYKNGRIDYITYHNDGRIIVINNVYNYERAPERFGWYLRMSEDGTVIENGIKSDSSYNGGYFDNEYLRFSIDGAYRIYYNNGEPKFFANAVFNRPFGIQRKYYDDGSLRAVYGYIYGDAGSISYYGICQEYYETGQIKSEEIYEKNKYVSIFGKTEYKPSCISEKKYDQNGILRIENTKELYKTYDETGALLSEKKYINRGYDEHWRLVYIKEYNKNTDTFSIEYIDPIPSERKRKANYDKNGMIYGNAIIYDKNKKVIEAQFKDGILNGEYKAYYSNGKIRAKVNFKDGKADGIGEYYKNKNGKLFSKSSYKKGIKEGKEYLYYPDGKLFAEMEWQDDRDKNTEKILYMNTYYYGKNTDNDIYEDEEWGLFPLYEFIYVPLHKGFDDEYNGSQAVGSDQDHDCGPGPLTRDEIYQEHRLTGNMTVFDKNGKLLYKKNFKKGKLIE